MGIPKPRESYITPPLNEVENMNTKNNTIQYPVWAQLVKDFGGMTLTFVGILITITMLIPIKDDVNTLKTDMTEVKKGIQELLKKP
jgi:macrodomain Ter protein organizer (MatP/YcbG family)